MICAALWPDPADENCPQDFRDAAARLITEFADKVYNTRSLHDTASKESFGQWEGIVTARKEDLGLDPNDPAHLNKLRFALLDFIADFANWDNSTVSAYLDTSRALTQAAHEALGGAPGTRPLVVDPFAGGGSIPLEALRVGADAFASDLNPIPVLLNKVVLEYIPKYGQRLADEVRKWGEWIKREAEKELTEFYPRDEDGSTPIAYLWARTILSEAPGQGDIPVEVPLMRSLWLAKKAGRRRALRWVRDPKGKVRTQTVEVAYVEDGQRDRQARGTPAPGDLRTREGIRRGRRHRRPGQRHLPGHGLYHQGGPRAGAAQVAARRGGRCPAVLRRHHARVGARAVLPATDEGRPGGVRRRGGGTGAAGEGRRNAAVAEGTARQ